MSQSRKSPAVTPNSWSLKTIDCADTFAALKSIFWSWVNQEKGSEDRFGFFVPLIFVDVAGDRNAGIILSQLIYWYGTNSQGKSRLKNAAKGLAKTRTEWWDECRLTPEEADRALDILSGPMLLPVRDDRDNSLVERPPLIRKEYHRFRGLRTTYIMLHEKALLATWQYLMQAQKSTPETYALAKQQRAAKKRLVKG